MKEIYNNGVEATIKVIGGKWKPLILCHLGHGPMRTGDLKRKSPSITQKMLTQQLRELEEDNIISREVFDQVPPKVIYALTEEGRTLKEVLTAMSIWGENRIKQRKAKGESVELMVKDHNGFINM